MAIKRDFLKTVVEGITNEQIDKIMAEVGKTETEHNNAISAKDADIAAKQTTIDTLNQQIAARDADLTKLRQEKGADADLQQKLTELQQKYDDDTKTLNEQLTTQAQQHETERLFAGIEFTSEYAKQGAMAAFAAKKYKWDGKSKTFEGAEAFIDTLKKDAKAVVQPNAQPDEGNGGDEGNDPQQQQEPKPNFAKGTGGGNGGGSKNPFDFSGLNFVREPPKAK